MRASLYISVPVTIDWAEVVKVITKLEDTKPRTITRYWVRNTPYFPSILTNADTFIFMTLDNLWKFDVRTLPSGVQKELKIAQQNNKPIFMVYKNMEGEYNFYKTTQEGNTIHGVSGSTQVIWKTLEFTEEKYQVLSSTNIASKRDEVIFDLEAKEKLANTMQEKIISQVPVTPDKAFISSEIDLRLLL